MGTSSIIVLVIGLAALVLLALWLFSAPKEKTPKTINVNIGENRSVRIDPSDNGNINIRVLDYDTWEDRPSDSEMCPDIVDDTINPDRLIDGRNVFDLLFELNKLDVETREKVLLWMEDHHFNISRDDIASIVLNDQESVENEPVNPDPSGDADVVPIGEDEDADGDNDNDIEEEPVEPNRETEEQAMKNFAEGYAKHLADKKNKEAKIALQNEINNLKDALDKPEPKKENSAELAPADPL